MPIRIPHIFFAAINPTVRLLLRSPIHAIWSDSLMLITFTGRKTGRRFSTPVRYLERDGRIWCFTSSSNKWWRNLRGGADVSLRIRGKELAFRATAVVDQPAKIRTALREFLSHFPGDAPYYDVRLGPDREPVAADLDRAAENTVMVEADPLPPALVRHGA